MKLDKIKYINHKNQSFTLGEDGTLVNEKSIRDYAWGYKASYNKVRSFYKNVATREIQVLFFGPNADGKANEVFQIIDKDVVEMEQGRLECGDYYINGFFYAIGSQRRQGDKITAVLKFVSARPDWCKEKTKIYNIVQGGSSTYGYLDLPHDGTYDYSKVSTNSDFYNDDYVDTDYRMTIVGPCTNPAVTINGHVYKVNAVVDEDEMLTIDSYEKTITLVNKADESDVANLFDYRERTSDIFEKISPGDNSVAWNGNFQFTLTLIERRSEPKWT